jgi:hypothetical protein
MVSWGIRDKHMIVHMFIQESMAWFDDGLISFFPWYKAMGIHEHWSRRQDVAAPNESFSIEPSQMLGMEEMNGNET